MAADLVRSRRRIVNKMGPQVEDEDGVALLMTPLGRDLPEKKETQRSKSPEEEVAETFWTTTLQVFFPFLIAGLGMVGAGLVLDVVQHWPVFQTVTELFILVPALLGLKGNLEMTLASRLSTQANLGRMQSPEDQWSLIKGNLALVQVQAIVVGFLASTVAVVMGWIPDGVFDIYHGLLISAASVATASATSLVLGVVMVLVIVGSHRFNINPDNVATPIAASLGDLTTLGLLSAIATLLFRTIAVETHLWWVSVCILAGYTALLPWFVCLANGNPVTKEVLSTGWSPVLAAMAISSVGGLILDYTVATYKGIAVFQPVINGVGGNLVAVQASRLSTWLHLHAGGAGRLPASQPRVCLSPAATFCAGDGHARTARVLLMLVLPGHVVFTLAINYLQAGHTSLTPVFLVIYFFVALLQVVLLLHTGHVTVLWMWRQGIDPDNSAIPYLTALGDLLGTGFLALAFHILYLIGDRDSDVGD